jgi:hypothetical protein
MKLLWLSLLLLLSGCTMLQARYIPLCEGSPITTPCLGYCNVPTRAANGVPTLRRLPYAVLITDQAGRIACQEVEG